MRPEDSEMAAIFDYIRRIDSIKDIAFHCPNEAKRTPQAGARMKRIGMLAGVSDIFIPKASKGFYGLFIEVKARSAAGYYGKPTKTQLDFIEKVMSEGYFGVVSYGADEAIDTIRWYLSGEPILAIARKDNEPCNKKEN